MTVQRCSKNKNNVYLSWGEGGRGTLSVPFLLSIGFATIDKAALSHFRWLVLGIGNLYSACEKANRLLEQKLTGSQL
jgi:hypothetical protein